jgi:hypothetical protein
MEKLIKVTDSKDRQLVFRSTTISVGNGESTPFWEARWLQGVAPRDLSPSLYKIARFKTRSVQTEMYNSNWIINLQNIHTSVQLEEFTLLFMTLSAMSLNEDKDKIT